MLAKSAMITRSTTASSAVWMALATAPPRRAVSGEVDLLAQIADALQPAHAAGDDPGETDQAMSPVNRWAEVPALPFAVTGGWAL